MIANYGYEDGSGFYYITIDGNKCALCKDHSCMSVCPAKVYGLITDDYDDLVAVVAQEARRRLRELCAACKGLENQSRNAERGENINDSDDDKLPCANACLEGAITHSW